MNKKLIVRFGGGLFLHPAGHLNKQFGQAKKSLTELGEMARILPRQLALACSVSSAAW
ncbi:hypothetical protein [Dongshaea marina]|uniref:hypothetical protein n=1 Tax=Dongshaea marina TaxID=2047966 RepID=UPI00131EFD51|nr:hypothetical protein [Dongshaea marina]